MLFSYQWQVLHLELHVELLKVISNNQKPPHVEPHRIYNF